MTRTGKTAAELIAERADSRKPSMGLGALLRGRLSVIPPFFASGKRNGQVAKPRAQAAARLALERV